MTDPRRYDAFISYRRGDPDEAFALRLLHDLEAAGYKVAVDQRDFDANATFLDEMERCIKESRFTLAVVSPRYLDSGNCGEEAIICKVLDMGERRRRLLPLVVHEVERPVWLYDLVGVDFTKPSPLLTPFERLKKTLGDPMSQGASGSSAVGLSSPSAKAFEADVASARRRRALTLAGIILLACLVTVVLVWKAGRDHRPTKVTTGPLEKRPNENPVPPSTPSPITVALIDQSGQVVEDEAAGYLSKFFRQPVKVTIFQSFDGLSASDFTHVMVRNRDTEGRLFYGTFAGTRPVHLVDKGGTSLKAAVQSETGKIPESTNIVRVALVSEAKNLPAVEVQHVAAAIGKQVTRDFAPWWGIRAEVLAYKTLADVPAGAWPIIVQEEVTAPGTATFHSDKDGVPFAMVTSGKSNWSHAASRECLQMLADPFANRLITVPSPDPDAKGKKVQLLVEVCSPLGDSSYEIDNVRVSDFCTPGYFGDLETRTGILYSYTGAAEKPRQLLKDGYFSWLESDTKEWKQQLWFNGTQPRVVSLGRIDH